MSKSTAAIYAQLRRDNEIVEREALKALVPEQYFTTELKNSGDVNMSTKVIKATKSYLEDIVVDSKSSQVIQDPTQILGCSDDAITAQPFSIPHRGVQTEVPDECIRQLRQVTTRLVQKAEEKIEGDGHDSDLLKKFLGLLSDIMVDATELVERPDLILKLGPQ